MSSIALALLVASVVLPTDCDCQDATVTVTAQFVDFDGKPIKGVRLDALFIKGNKGNPRAVSGDDGTVVLKVAWPPERVAPPRSWPQLPPLDRLLCLRAIGTRTVAYCMFKRVNERKRIDLGIIRLRPGGDVTGRVLGPDGKPVSGVRIEARIPLPTEPGIATFDAESHRVPPRGVPTFSDRNGRYRLEGVPDTFVSVMAKAAGTLHCFSDPIAVPEGRTAAAGDIMLRPAAESQLIRGVVRGSNDVPLPNVRLCVSDGTAIFPATRTWTRADGRFEFLVLPNKAYTIDVAGIAPPTMKVRGGNHAVTLRINRPDAAAIRRFASRYDPEPREPEPPYGMVGPCVLRGHFLLDGKPPAGWTCKFQDMYLVGVPIDTAGRFQLRAKEPKEYEVLQSRCLDTSQSWATFVSSVKLAVGENTWKADTATGTVVVENLEPLPSEDDFPEDRLRPEDQKSYRLCWNGRHIQWLAVKTRGSETTWRIDQVPAGEIEVSLDGNLEDPNPRHRSLRLRHFTLKAGERKVVRLR